MAELSRLNVLIEGNSSGLDATLTKTEKRFDQFGRVIGETDKVAKKTTSSTDKLKRAVDRVRRSTDSAFAATKHYERAKRTLDAALKQEVLTEEQHAAALQKVAIHYKQTGAAAGSFNKQIRTSRFHTANLAAQFNDIGVMMASGQSPFILAMQQGTQVTQVLQTMGGTAKQQLGALVQAVTRSISPLSILTIGLIAGAAALYQYATRTDEAEEDLKTFEDKVNDVKKAVENLKTQLTQTRFKLSSAEEARVQDVIIAKTAERTALIKRIARITKDGIAKGEAAALGDATRRVAILEEELNLSKEVLAEMEKLRALIAGTKEVNALAKAYGDIDAFLAEDINKAKELREEEKKRQEILALEHRARNETNQELLVAQGLAEAAKENHDYILDKAREITEQERLVGAGLREAVTASTLFWLELEKARKEAERIAAVDFGQIWAAAGMGSPEEQIMAMPVTVDAEGVRNSKAEATEIKQEEARTKREAEAAARRAARAKIRREEENLREQEDRQLKLERLQEYYMTEAELEISQHNARLYELYRFRSEEKEMEEHFDNLIAKERQKHAKRMAQIDLARYGSQLDKAQYFMGAMADSLAQGNEKMLKIAKVFGAAEALINAWRGYADVLANAPWYVKIPAAAAVVAAGLNAVQAIKGVSKGGIGQSSAGGATGTNTAVSSAPTAEARASAVNINVRGQVFDRGAVIGLIDQINDAVGDGARIRAT